MKKFNVAKSVESEKKKSPPEKKIFYSLIMCVFAIALFTSFFSGKMEKKINEAAKNVKPAQTEPEKVSEVYIPPESKTDIGEAEAKEEKSDVITIKPEVEAPAGDDAERGTSNRKLCARGRKASSVHHR